MKDNKEGENADDGLGDYDESSAADIAKLLGFGGFGTTKVRDSYNNDVDIINDCRKNRSLPLPFALFPPCDDDDKNNNMKNIMTRVLMIPSYL